jgi:hypothetical protein
MKKNQKFFLIATAIFIIIVYVLKTENTNYHNTKETISEDTNSSNLTKNQLKRRSDSKKYQDKKTDKKNINNVVGFNELLNSKSNPVNNNFVFDKERDDEIMRMAEKEIFSKAFQD